MKKLILICGLFASSLSFGAKWVYVASSSSGLDFYVDKNYYKFNKSTNTVDMWLQIESRKSSDPSKRFVVSKSLDRYQCSNKSFKNLAQVLYFETGEI